MSLFSGARLLTGTFLQNCRMAGLVAAAAVVPVAHAQSSGGGWFVPKAAHPTADAPAPSHMTRRVAPPISEPQQSDEDQQPQTPPVLPQPPIPNSPEIPKEAPPPPAIIGVISVQDVMAQSAAAQEVQRVIGERRDQLAQEAQRAQEGLRAERDRLQGDAKSMSSDQFNVRARHLQEEAIREQRDFRNRARVVQEALQVSLDQIERELKVIIPQVAKAHGMNLVMHLEQIAMHLGGQDISDEVAQHLNQVMPHVYIPAANVDPEVLAKSGKMPTTADAQGQNGGPQPASEPAPPASVLRQH